MKTKPSFYLSTCILIGFTLATQPLVAQLDYDNYPGNDRYYIIAKHSGKALDISGGSVSAWARATLQQSSLKDATIQQFRFEKVSEGIFRIRNVASNLYLEIKGEYVWQYPKSESLAQLFHLEETGNGYFLISSLDDLDRYLTIRAGSQQEGAIIRLAEFNGNDDQRFSFVDIESRKWWIADSGLKP